MGSIRLYYTSKHVDHKLILSIDFYIMNIYHRIKKNIEFKIPIFVKGIKENISWGYYDYTTPKHVDHKLILSIDFYSMNNEYT